MEELKYPIGKFKARVFKTVLGLTEVDAEKLKGIILGELGNSEAILTKTDLYGSRYTVDLKISNLGGHSVLRTAWIVSESDNIPRLITCFIK